MTKQNNAVIIIDVAVRYFYITAEKVVRMGRGFDEVILLDIYGELLAKSQREALDMRYNADLSLAEIADEMGGITRQSVLYSIKKGEQRLDELEEKLGFAQRLKALSAQLDTARELVSQLRGEYNKNDERFERIEALIDDIKSGL